MLRLSRVPIPLGRPGRPSASTSRSDRSGPLGMVSFGRRVLVALGVCVFALVAFPVAAGALAHAGVPGVSTTATSAMTWWKAAILGTIEGLTEYLPVSSTGHLLVASNLLGLGDTKADQAAANTYAIAIQFGAIIAVAGVFWRRFAEMIKGLFGRSDAGRHLLIITLVAFAPAAVLGAVFNNTIEDKLFGSWPIIAAWIVGGVLILALERAGRIPRGHHEPADDTGRDPLLDITNRQALLIGFAQVLAMWPGTSRSLATILGALLVGVGMRAAVEFSFVLGFVTLTAASCFSLISDGSGLVDQFGVVDPLIGLGFAFVAAVLAIRWMIAYLERNSLAIFGWYRLGVAAVAIGLIGFGVL